MPNTSCKTRILHDFFNDGETLDLSPTQQQLKDDGFPWGFFDPKKHVSRRHPDDRRGSSHSWGVCGKIIPTRMDNYVTLESFTWQFLR